MQLSLHALKHPTLGWNQSAALVSVNKAGVIKGLHFNKLHPQNINISESFSNISVIGKQGRDRREVCLRAVNRLDVGKNCPFIRNAYEKVKQAGLELCFTELNMIAARVMVLKESFSETGCICYNPTGHKSSKRFASVQRETLFQGLALIMFFSVTTDLCFPDCTERLACY